MVERLNVKQCHIHGLARVVNFGQDNVNDITEGGAYFMHKSEHFEVNR